MEKGAIEIAPLAYMRGRTLNDAFIILDEAQNSTTEQMKMFLTRLGFNSKMVITGRRDAGGPAGVAPLGAPRGAGDPPGRAGIPFVYFDEHDVVRHPLVSAIIRAYGAYDARSAGRNARRPARDGGRTALMPAAGRNRQRQGRGQSPSRVSPATAARAGRARPAGGERGRAGRGRRRDRARSRRHAGRRPAHRRARVSRSRRRRREAGSSARS